MLRGKEYVWWCLMLTAYLGLSKEAINSLRSLKPCKFLPSPGASHYRQRIDTIWYEIKG